MNKKDVIGVTPFNLGWLEYRLNSQEMEYLWRCIKKKQDDYRSSLAGNISGSYKLMDRGDWFFYNTLRPLFLQYQDQFCNLGKDVPVPPALLYPYYLVDWWVNIQKQNDFNPMHRHGGVYSFVIWMKIPTEWKKQNLGNKTNCPRISSFEISGVPLSQVICSKSSALTVTSALGLIAKIAFAIFVIIQLPPLLL